MLVLEKTSSPKAGTYVEQVGTYNPKTKEFSANAESIKGWITKGAQLSPSLQNLLINKGVIEGKKSAAVVKEKNLIKNVAKKAEEEAAAKAAAEAAAVAAAAEVPAEPTEAEVTAEAVEAPIEEVVAETAAEEVKEEAAA